MDYKFKHGDKVRVVRLNSQCTAQNSSRIKVGDVFTIEGPLDRSFVGSNERIYSVQEKHSFSGKMNLNWLMEYRITKKQPM